jgi:predicted phage tail protein
MAGVLCEGEIQSIEEIYVDDKLVTFASALTHGTVVEVGSGDANFYKDSTSHIQVQAFLGLDNQVSSSILSTSTNWGTDHRLRGVAYLAFRFKWNQDIFGSLPDIKVVVKGKKIYDPRTTTTAYSSNSALCLLDYLRNPRYGKGLPDSAFEANFQSFQDSADECETQVTPYSGGTDIDLFETNAVIDSSQKLINNVSLLLNPMRAIFSYNQGTYKLNIENTGTATYTITADNVIGGIKVIGETKNKKYNRVIGTFVNPEKNWQEDTVTFPPADDSALPVGDQHATLLALDNGTLLEGNFDFPYITNPYQAEELCEIILRRSRNALAIEVTVTSEFLDVVVGDILNITYTTAGFSAKPFRVYSVTINPDLTVALSLTEHQDNFYTWTSKSEAPTIADTNLPNPNVVQPPASVTLSDQLIAYNDGTVIVALDIAIGASPDSFVDYYQVEYKKQSETDYQIHGQGTGLNQRVLNVIDQEVYDVRVKAVNSIGASSTYVTATRTIVGSTEAPADVTDFSCNIIGSEAHLSWEQIPDLDLAYYQIRFSTLTTGAEWNNSVSLIEKVSRPATSILYQLEQEHI